MTGALSPVAGGPPCILVANHGHYADGMVLAVAAGFPRRLVTFVAHGALRWGWGLGALLVAPCNTVCVDLDRGRGTSALRTGARLLASGQALMLFPEGWAHLDGRRRPFRAGAVAMAQLAARRSGQRVDLLPASIRYPRHSGQWLTRWPPAVQYGLTFLASPWFRRGAVVRVGSPIDVRTLPVDAAAATRVLEAAVDALGTIDSVGAAVL